MLGGRRKERQEKMGRVRVKSGKGGKKKKKVNGGKGD